MRIFPGRIIGIGVALVCASMSLTATAQVVPLSNFAELGRSVQRSTITEYGGNIYFGVGVDNTTQRELWRFDGTDTEIVASGFVGDSDLSIDGLVEFQNQLYFSASANGTGQELYRYDGRNVTLAADIAPGGTSSYPVGLKVHNNELFFSAKQGESFNNLYKFDGTSASLVSSFADPRASVVTGITYRGDLYFGADQGVEGMELWKYDGTNVQPIADLNPGAADSFPRDFTIAGDRMFFKATTAEHGQEIWQYDGNNVSLTDDVNPGANSSDPRFLTDVDGQLMFSAVAFGKRYVFEYDLDSPASQIIDGGGPIGVGDELYTIRGRDVGGVEINDLYDFEGNFVRSMVPSAGPFETLDGDLFFSCACSKRELFKLAPAGDANVDGAVDFGDFLTLTKNFGTDGHDWDSGDFDRDGKVAFSDFLLQSGNFGDFKSGKRALASVPEPTSASSLLTICLSVFLFRRRRSNVGNRSL